LEISSKEEFEAKFNFYLASQQSLLTEEFIDEYSDQLYWYYISQYQDLSETFIEKHIHDVDFGCICIYQKLSEAFIEKYIDHVGWACAIAYQALSEEFLEKHGDVISWDLAAKYQNLSESCRKKHNLEIPKDNWLYASKEDKIAAIKANMNYEVIDDSYIIAYKAIRPDDYSFQSFRYKYLSGNYYESNCDCNIKEDNSFGLAAWDKACAIAYGKAKSTDIPFCLLKNLKSKFKIIKVKILINDIGAITKNGKIRCRKFFVLGECKSIFRKMIDFFTIG
jgi:hypothetical protein